MIKWLSREAVHLWYYLDIQIRQIAPYWALGIVLGSAVSVYCAISLAGRARNNNKKKRSN